LLAGKRTWAKRRYAAFLFCHKAARKAVFTFFYLIFLDTLSFWPQYLAKTTQIFKQRRFCTMKNNCKLIFFAVFCTCTLLLGGCASGTKIILTQEKYSPSFRAADFARYKGKKLVLASFFNQAQNTKTYNYFSPDKKLNYEGNVSLENLYLNGFTKAFKHIGVTLVDYVYDEDYRNPRNWWWGYPGPSGYRAPKGVPELQFIVLSMTDQELTFKIILFKDGQTKLDKDLTVKMAPAATEDVAALEKRGYQMVDLAFTTIMRDRDFQRAF